LKNLTNLLLITLTILCVTHTVEARAVTDRYDNTFRKYSKRFFGMGFDWRLFKAQGMAESNLDMNAKSFVGAQGIMQLMPTTFQEIRSKNPDIKAIDDPEWNIAAGIYYDRQLWKQWQAEADVTDQYRFMLGSYNAGRATLIRAQEVARSRTLNPALWPSIRTIAPEVPRWRHTETIDYVERIEDFLGRMDDDTSPQPQPHVRECRICTRENSPP
jgi:membrane-bound lytic murein transglycosylase MltF